MKRLLAALVCALAALVGAPARACTDPGGIGGTGIDPGGIGGTGQRAEAEIGVLGVITAFGSICVNGIEVHFDANTPVSLNGDLSSGKALAIGQVVSVLAVGAGTQARATWIDIVDTAVGRVTAVENAGTLLHVNQQRVRIDPSTVLGPDLSRAQLAAARVGDTLRVSGLRSADGTIIATRVETAPQGTRALATEPADPGLGRFLVQGYVADTEPQALRVGPTRFSVSPDAGAQLARGQLVRLSGRSEGGNRVVERADFLSGPFDERPQRTLRTDPVPRSGDDRRGGGEGDRSGRDSGDRSGRDGGDTDRSGRGGGDRFERSGPSDRPERVERSGSGGGDRPERVDRSGRR